MKLEKAPDWPQPLGIFESGVRFNALKFLTTLREVYKTFVIRGEDGGDLTMEYEAFSKLLWDRTIVTSDGLLFKLFNLEMSFSIAPGIVVERDGFSYL